MNIKIGTIMMAAALVAVGAQADGFGSGGNAFTLDFVNIGGAGNAGDTANTVNGINPGSVGYNYRIGMHEVTIDQFTKAHAASGNTIGNGNEGYWNDGTRTVGTGGPVSYVSWNEAARFANWLSSGDANTGVYSFSGGLVSGIDRSYRNGSDLAYVLPSEDEWYKAAYYKPVNDGSYSLFANGDGTVAVPGTAPTHGTSSGWNYHGGSSPDYVNGAPNYMWENGFGAEEQNGTFDMMGNAYEWNESALDGSTNDMTTNRVFRGGSAYGLETTLTSSYRASVSPTFETYFVGFRVAAIPEPSSLAMVGLVSGLGVFIRRRLML